jgi:hypothetical protein
MIALSNRVGSNGLPSNVGHIRLLLILASLLCSYVGGRRLVHRLGKSVAASTFPN